VHTLGVNFQSVVMDKVEICGILVFFMFKILAKQNIVENNGSITTQG